MPANQSPATINTFTTQSLGRQLGQLCAQVAKSCCTSAQACHAVSEARAILQQLRHDPDQTDWETALDLIEELECLRHSARNDARPLA